MHEKTFYLISLGCAKNTVDSSSIATLLEDNGYTQSDKENQAELLIVNTCGFIQPAREEAVEVLQDLAKKKRRGQLLIAAGCLPERHADWMVQQVQGVDGVLGTKNWMDILQLIQQLRQKTRPEPLFHLPESPTISSDEK
ncbi:30S ribosomal protein S12 methylthiotransferase RimO, partial [bacterium]|nr:30S ribosomal protein S12 methylthiotransferase RimO [bacterium]